MIQKANKTLSITTALCLLPIILGLVLYDRLPAEIAVHFTDAGEPDGFLPRAVTVFGLPVALAVLNVYSHFRMNHDPRAENASSALKQAAKWALPLIAVVVIPVTLFLAVGAKMPVSLIAQALTGAMITVVGNYLPKCRRNYTVGITLPWTLHSETNWNKTHRFAGFLWVAGGLLFTANAFLGIPYLGIGIIVLILTLPSVFSCVSYRKGGAGA